MKLSGPYVSKIQKLLDKMPSDWKRQLSRASDRLKALGLGGIPKKPTVREALRPLALTAGGNFSGDVPFGPNKVPKAVRDAAMKGIALSYMNNYGAWDFIGMARAIELATVPSVSDETMRRMKGYFSRHRKDVLGKNFGNDDNPSRGYMAWLNWGGDPGAKWVGANTELNPRLPKRYGTSPQRLKELAAQRRRYRRGTETFKLLPTDIAARKAGKVKASAYTEVAKDRGLTLKDQDFHELAERALDYYGAKGNVDKIAAALEKSYDKGLAAWASGGHRPGASSHNWANARISSLLVGGKTYWSTDRKQAESFPPKMHRAIIKQIDDVLDALEDQGRRKDVTYIESQIRR
jgi:hypothetical protein